MASLSAAILARPPPQTAADPSPTVVAAAAAAAAQQEQEQQAFSSALPSPTSTPSTTPPTVAAPQKAPLSSQLLINSESLRDHLFAPAAVAAIAAASSAQPRSSPTGEIVSSDSDEQLPDAPDLYLHHNHNHNHIHNQAHHTHNVHQAHHAAHHGRHSHYSHRTRHSVDTLDELDSLAPLGSPNTRAGKAIAAAAATTTAAAGTAGSSSAAAASTAEEKNRLRRINKIRYRSQSSATELQLQKDQHNQLFSSLGDIAHIPGLAPSLTTFDFPSFPGYPAGSVPMPGLSIGAMEPPVLSFYGAEPVPLPSRFAHIKRRLAEGHQDAIHASWARLLDALAVEVRRIAEQGPALIPSIDFAAIHDPDAVTPFQAALKSCGVGVVRGVVPRQDTAAWVDETRAYLQPADDKGTDIKPPPPQDPTCFDFFWTPAQVRARAHPNVLQAMRFAMGFWTPSDPKAAGTPLVGDPRMAIRFPISYADRIRIHVDAEQVKLVQQAKKADKAEKAEKATDTGSLSSIATPAATAPTATTTPTATPIIAQVDGGSLERWEPDGYGRGGTYDSVFRGRWEDYDPWDPAGRVQATPDLYNGAGACSIFRMFQGLLALTDVTPGMIRLMPSPKLASAYFLLRPFFRPKVAAPADNEASPAAWAAYLDASNWELEGEPSTIIHGAVPGHAQRVTELWHPHLQLRQSLLTPPRLQAGDYIVWHCDTPYLIASEKAEGGPSSSPSNEPAEATSTTATAMTTATAPASVSDTLSAAPMLVYVPACPLTQTNALYLARQRKAFMRGHPGPDFDATGSGLGSEADHASRPGEAAIEAVGGREGLRAMGLLPWDVERAADDRANKADKTGEDAQRKGGNAADNKDGQGAAVASVEGGDKMDVEPAATSPRTEPLSQAELELVRLANIILFPDQYEFYMPTRHNSPDRE
ncbi:hypothetical protein SCUCBS95973_009760 [Sporothrix curviconia]|uniref:Uncharacterized protein n=1 Tax=Sporothrix curviconia TaxID=1260050 RepID=A0ABP0CXL3_9PEZI